MSFDLSLDDLTGPIQKPQNFIRVKDPDLKNGRVVMRTFGYTEPHYGKGNFAVAFKFETASGEYKALRFFFRKPDDLTKRRYGELGLGFRQSQFSPYVANFTYYDHGFFLKGQKIPMIVMEWIDHDLLADYVFKTCASGNSIALKLLFTRWREMVSAMKTARIAHGDLSSGNIIVRQSDQRLFLVDYDDVFMPGLEDANRKVAGTLDYQHPSNPSRSYGPDMDDFSIVVISTVLLALSIQPNLWSKHVRAGDEHFLFKKSDFQMLEQSVLYQELRMIADPDLQHALNLLFKACKAPSDGPFDLGNLLIDRRWEELKNALLAGDEMQVATLWHAVNHLPDAKQYATQAIPIAERIYERQLIALSLAIQSGNSRWMRWAHDRLIDQNLDELTPLEQARLQQSMAAMP